LTAHPIARQEFLNANWFTSLDQARRLASRWRADYNANHRHSALEIFAESVRRAGVGTSH